MDFGVGQVIDQFHAGLARRHTVLTTKNDLYRAGDPLGRDLYRQMLELRELLEAVARELERLAASEPNLKRRGQLLRRALG